MIVAVVPVKSLDATKSRLLPRLGAEGVRRLSLAMLGDVVEALRGVPEIDRIAVATPDIEVASEADELGVEALLRQDPGLNPSIEAAGAELLPNPDDGLLSLHRFGIEITGCAQPSEDLESDRYSRLVDGPADGVVRQDLEIDVAGTVWKNPTRILAVSKPLALNPTFLLQEARLLFEARLDQFAETFEGVEALLSELDLPFCLATNAPVEKAELVMRTTKLDRFFGNRLFSAYEVGTWKPEPGLFLHAADTMQTPPDRCLVVEDSAFGIEAGLAAGMHVLQFCSNGEEPLHHNHFHHYSNFHDAVEAGLRASSRN